MSVTPVDFGKDRRESARIFSRLMGLVEAHEAAVLADPMKYLDLAGREIATLRERIREARDALRRPVEHYTSSPDFSYKPMRTMTVMADEYERLRRVADMVVALADEPRAASHKPE